MSLTPRPDLHDAERVGVAGGRAEGKLALTVQLPDGSPQALHLAGCRGWRIAEILPQNGVSRATVSGGAGDGAPVRALIDWLAATPAGPALPGADGDTLASAVLRGELRILSIEASTGAEAAVVFETFDLDPPPG